jgi:hypothetical protein
MFNIDQRIICIDDYFSPESARCFHSLPVKGGIYTVRSVERDGDKIGVLLREIDGDHVFGPRRFRAAQ